MRRPSPTVIALIAGVFVLLLLVYVFAGGSGSNSDKLSDDQATGGTSADDPEKRCGSQATYDLIKRELFRRAAEVRGSDQAAFDRLAAYSVVRMDSPMLRSHDEDLGRVECAGALALDLPPGVAVVGGRRTLTANVGYAVQPSADGNGDVLTLSSAEGIIAPLATLARVGSATGEPLAPAAANDPSAAGSPSAADDPFATAAPPAAATPPVQTPPPSAAPARATASPSFNCGNARTRGEIAVCGDSGLASLDRQMASQFNSAIAGASSEERALLQRTRIRFLSYRDSCRSDSCIADAYRGRMREIQDIREGRWRGR
jgi:uncharacterized protein YecT (DUF1311 family)